jgi:hypothetical protein
MTQYTPICAGSPTGSCGAIGRGADIVPSKWSLGRGVQCKPKTHAVENSRQPSCLSVRMEGGCVMEGGKRCDAAFPNLGPRRTGLRYLGAWRFLSCCLCCWGYTCVGAGPSDRRLFSYPNRDPPLKRPSPNLPDWNQAARNGRRRSSRSGRRNGMGWWRSFGATDWRTRRSSAR